MHTQWPQMSPYKWKDLDCRAASVLLEGQSVLVLNDIGKFSKTFVLLATLIWLKVEAIYI